VGIYLFDLTIFDAIRRTPRTAMRDEYEITHSIQVLIDDGYPVRALHSIEEDVNLTYPVDLLRCNLEQARLLSRENIIGENVSIHPQAQIIECIIGSNVRIDHPVQISRSLIFSGSTVNVTTNLDSHIVTPDGMVECRMENLV
jgi:dTDP-glucose pyrophosphorylase